MKKKSLKEIFFIKFKLYTVNKVVSIKILSFNGLQNVHSPIDDFHRETDLWLTLN